MKKDSFDFKNMLSSLNEFEYKEKIKKEVSVIEERSYEWIRAERKLFLRIRQEFTSKNGFTKMEYGILKLKMHIYQEEKKEYRSKYQHIQTFLETSDHEKDQFYKMEMYMRKMGRCMQKIRDFHEWVEEMIDTKKIEREMKKLHVQKKNSMYVSPPESDRESL
jgi:hypothetical protein